MGEWKEIISMSNEQTVLKERGEKTITLAQNGSIKAERERLRVTYGPSKYQPTGCYVEKGDELVITLQETDQEVLPQLVISPFILENYKDAAKDGIELAIGENRIKAEESGILYFINESEATEKPPQLTISGVRFFPTFELGKTTIEKWRELWNTYKDAPVFELVTDKVFITSSSSFKDLVSDPTEVLKVHNQIVDIQARLSGLREDDEPLHQPTKFRYHFRQTNEPYYMYAYYNHTGYSEEGMPYVLDADKLKNDGWGPWHELGHVHQQTAWTTRDLVEVTVNLFSLTVQREFGGTSRLETDGIYEKAFAYLEQEEKDFSKVDIWEKLVMLWQLDLAYGEDFYPQLFRLIRETPIDQLPEEEEEKVQKLIVWTSKVAKQNLIPFYKKWGLIPTPEIEQEVLQLGYPEIEAEIWRNRDTNNFVKPN